ncbi:MAG: UDP-N-acetylmuramoyl-tripeptide--D-alanyl-D-alanine ligase [Planctomycetota bacterium]
MSESHPPRPDFWTPEGFRTAMSGRWIHRPLREEKATGTLTPAAAAASAQSVGGSSSSEAAGLGEVSTDTRTLKPGDVFFALRGERFDGHGFLRQAIDRGAGMLVVDSTRAAESNESIDWPDPVHVLEVDDTRRALQRLAAAWRRTLTNLTVVAITGSCGKTTTKQILHGVLSSRLTGRASPKSYNNDVGVPLTLLSARPRDQYLIVEVGTNAPGEIAALSALVEPDIAVITHVGRSHLEGLGTLADVAREKGSLVNSLRPKGLAVLNADAFHLRKVLGGHANAIWYGRAEDADVRLTDCRLEFAEQKSGSSAAPTDPAEASDALSPGMHFETNGRRQWFVPLPGEHQALNSIAAIVVARRLGLTDDEIADALKTNVRPVDGRMQLHRFGTICVFNDAYNANPDSMEAALRTFVTVTEKAATAVANRPDAEESMKFSRVLVLGDMLELGDRSGEYHRELGRSVFRLHSRCQFRLIWCVGPLTASMHEELKRHGMGSISRHVKSLDDADTVKEICRSLQPGDRVLVKGSRSGRLERVVEQLESSNGSTNEIDSHRQARQPAAPQRPKAQPATDDLSESVDTPQIDTPQNDPPTSADSPRRVMSIAPSKTGSS